MHYTSQGCFWLRQYPPHDDQGMFPPSTTGCYMLTCCQESMLNKSDYIELGLACADVCKALDRGMNGRRAEELSQSVGEAIEQLTT